MRMDAFHDTNLEMLLKGLGADTVVITGAWTNFSIEHTARHAADAGYRDRRDGRYVHDQRRVTERGAQLRADANRGARPDEGRARTAEPGRPEEGACQEEGQPAIVALSP
jgi:hypothetical protein